MKFIVRRTSDWYDNSPCEECKKELVTSIDRRTVKTLEEAKKSGWYQHWYDRTINHREEKGCVAGDVIEKREVWIIEIKTLEELMELNKKYGDIIVKEDDGYHEITNQLEIYDDYRE